MTLNASTTLLAANDPLHPSLLLFCTTLYVALTLCVSCLVWLQGLSNSCWALAKLGLHPGPRFLEALLEALGPRLPEMKPQVSTAHLRPSSSSFPVLLRGATPVQLDAGVAAMRQCVTRRRRPCAAATLGKLPVRC